MRYITDRKRAVGRGASGTGTEHHWHMQVSAVALAILTPVFVFGFGATLGKDYDQVRAFFGNPFWAIWTALFLVVSMRHFAAGATMMIEDYWRGTLRKGLIITVISLSWLVSAVGLFALVKMAL
ncbi:succinate dehydrogenase, hydrophobic membrane anchor protein [Frigidibacter sp. MR17.24]|uniref:succinate dehydrogenase, hydrophobic membrane anchor protein n=1 Tax=Frigidibacter sp. MR17.24 TaxID=3127345 RepID=UPI003012C4CA